MPVSQSATASQSVCQAVSEYTSRSRSVSQSVSQSKCRQKLTLSANRRAQEVNGETEDTGSDEHFHTSRSCRRHLHCRWQGKVLIQPEQPTDAAVWCSLFNLHLTVWASGELLNQTEQPAIRAVRLARLPVFVEFRVMLGASKWKKLLYFFNVLYSLLIVGSFG